MTLVINQWPLHLADIVLISIGNTKNASCFAMQKVGRRYIATLISVEI